jgi:lipoprotein-anchoring transpeptidase ErfK/SrfK
MTRIRTFVALLVAVVALGATAIESAPVNAQILPPAQDPPPEQPPPPPPPPPEQPPAPTLRRGDNNADVQNVQQRLKNLAYDPGAINGRFGKETEVALFAFQKVNNMAPTGQVTPDVRAALDNPVPPPVMNAGLGPDRVEVNLTRQLLTIYRGGAPALISHISSGNNQRYCVRRRRCAMAVTPQGIFAIGRMVRGWETSPLGRMYKSAYFYRGFALHGSLSVPLAPASHGCIRVPMHTAAWFQGQLFRGMPVIVGS